MNRTNMTDYLTHLNITDQFYQKYFFPNPGDVFNYNLNPLGNTFLTILAFCLSTFAVFGYLFYIAYFKSKEDNECRLLNCLTSVLAINYIIATMTSVATIIYYNKGIKYHDQRFGSFWKIMRIYSGVNTVLVFGELTLASILNMNYPSIYLAISLKWNDSWTMILNFSVIFLWHTLTILSCKDETDKWTSACVMETLMRGGIFLFIPIIIAQSAIIVDCLWGWKKITKKILRRGSNVVHPMLESTNQELDQVGITTGFLSLMVDTSVRVTNNIIMRAGYIDGTIVIR